MSMNEDDLVAGLRDLGRPDLNDRLAGRILADAALEMARRETPGPSEMLMARIARDARTEAGRRRRFERTAVGALAVACAAGLAVGLFDPGGLVTQNLAPAAAYTVEDLGGGYDFQYAGLLE